MTIGHTTWISFFRVHRDIHRMQVTYEQKVSVRYTNILFVYGQNAVRDRVNYKPTFLPTNVYYNSTRTNLIVLKKYCRVGDILLRYNINTATVRFDAYR